MHCASVKQPRSVMKNGYQWTISMTLKKKRKPGWLHGTD